MVRQAAEVDPEVLQWYRDAQCSWEQSLDTCIYSTEEDGPTINDKTFSSANPLHQGLSKDVPVRVSSSGRVEWTVGTLTTTVCDADPFFFPADTMDCQICFSATSAIKQTIQCHGGSSPSDAHEESHPCDSFSPAKPDGEWYRRDMIFAKDRKEACFSVQLSRIPTFHIATTVGPCVILIVLMTITFIMPIDQGDRISFGVTIQLSMVVSLVFVTEVLPVKGALPFLATLIIVCMGLMGLFLFITVAVIFIYNKEGCLSPGARVLFLRYIARALLLGDLTKSKEKQNSSGTAIEMTNTAFCDDDVPVDDGASVAVMWLQNSGDPGRTGPPTNPPTAPESPGFLHLISSVRELTKVVKKGDEELTKAVKNGTERLTNELVDVKNNLTEVKSGMEELTRAVKSEEEVSDYTLLAKVLDRLCLVVYIISVVTAIPMTMYLSR
ncbi:CHRNA7-FAM7A fusion protein-like [Branchiostoma floridae]|uniref:CHRNA7-FAM7A fusion protein-like n=2 Tax=Branchiostoma floridae TaxID=7739 RepID=A0A9J7L0I8_BRAFL|nr:CHRNA7-FAM7A fusion protein-like [Branchiostoma floridae]